MHVLAPHQELLAEGSADGRFWCVHRERDEVVAVVESPAGRSEFHGSATAPLPGPAAIGRCGSDLAGRWWSVVTDATVTRLWIGDGPQALEPVDLPPAHHHRRHLLHPAGEQAFYRAELRDGRTVRGHAEFGALPG